MQFSKGSILVLLGYSYVTAQRPVVVTSAKGRPVVVTAAKASSSSAKVAIPVQITISTTSSAARSTLSTLATTTSTSTSPSTIPSTSTTATCTSPLPTYGCLPLTTQAVFVQAMLDQHNSYRARHTVAPLTWSNALAAAALTNAQKNADTNTFAHTTSNPYGENIAYQYGYTNPLYLGFLWYDEERLYNYTKPGFAENTGHFTQVVWLSSTELGCAYVQAKNALSSNGYYYLSCEYSPPGNYYGQFAQQVLPADSSPYPTQPAMRI